MQSTHPWQGILTVKSRERAGKRPFVVCPLHDGKACQVGKRGGSVELIEHDRYGFFPTRVDRPVVVRLADPLNSNMATRPTPHGEKTRFSRQSSRCVRPLKGRREARDPDQNASGHLYSQSAADSGMGGFRGGSGVGKIDDDGHCSHAIRIADVIVIDGLSESADGEVTTFIQEIGRRRAWRARWSLSLPGIEAPLLRKQPR